MIKQLKDTPDNIVAFSAEGTVTEHDFKQVVMPAVHELVARTGKLNYLMEINTPLGNFSGGAWWQDLLLGIKEIAKWERVAIVTESGTINTFTDIFSVFVPGTFKGFAKEDLQQAINWVSTGA